MGLGWHSGAMETGIGLGPQGQASPSLQWGDMGVGWDMGPGQGLRWDLGDQDGTRTERPSVPITVMG